MFNSILDKGADLLGVVIVSASMIGASWWVIAQTQQNCTKTITQNAWGGTLTTTVCGDTNTNVPQKNGDYVKIEPNGDFFSRKTMPNWQVCITTITKDSFSSSCK